MLQPLKAALIVVGTLLFALVATLLFFYDSQAHLAEEAFLRGDLPHAEELVRGFKEGPQKELALAYIERARQNLAQSNAHLAQAGSSGEVALNDVLNGYLNHQRFAVKSALERVPEEDWKQFFISLLDGTKGPSYHSLKPLSPWMKRSFDQVFTPLWSSIHEVRQLIVLGQTTKARKLLEQIKPNVHGAEEQDFDLAIALSYVKDAEKAPPLAATPYFKLAAGYLKRVPLHAVRYHPERQQIAQAVHNQVETLSTLNQTEALPFYTALLESLDANR